MSSVKKILDRMNACRIDIINKSIGQFVCELHVLLHVQK